MLQGIFIIFAGAFYNGFPIGVAIVLFNKTLNGREGMVINDRLQFSSRTLNNHMLVYLVITTMSIRISDLFIPAQFMLEEPKVPIREIRMFQGFA